MNREGLSQVFEDVDMVEATPAPSGPYDLEIVTVDGLVGVAMRTPYGWQFAVMDATRDRTSYWTFTPKTASEEEGEEDEEDEP